MLQCRQQLNKSILINRFDKTYFRQIVMRIIQKNITFRVLRMAFKKKKKFQQRHFHHHGGGGKLVCSHVIYPPSVSHSSASLLVCFWPFELSPAFSTNYCNFRNMLRWRWLTMARAAQAGKCCRNEAKPP